MARKKKSAKKGRGGGKPGRDARGSIFDSTTSNLVVTRSGSSITLGYGLHTSKPITYISVTVVANYFSNPQPLAVPEWIAIVTDPPATDVVFKNKTHDFGGIIGNQPALVRVDYYVGGGQDFAGSLQAVA